MQRNLHLDDIVQALARKSCSMFAKKLLDLVSILHFEVVAHGILQRGAIESVSAHNVGLDPNKVREDFHITLACRQVQCLVVSLRI